MKCKNCGTENSDNIGYCKKCKQPLTKNEGSDYKLDGISICIGVIVSIVLLAASFSLVSIGMIYMVIPIVFLTSCIAGILAKKNINNSAVNGAVTAFIAAIIFIITYIIVANMGFAIIVSVFGLTLIGILGGALGGLINQITSMEMKRKIAIFLILILVVSIAGYTFYQHRMEAKYDDNYVSQMFIMGLADTIQPEADADLNMKINTTNQKKTALNDAKTKYDRMKYLAGETKTWNMEMMGHASSNIEKEYCLALEKYVDLRYNYYNEMDTGINLSINGNEKEAQIHYQNAKKLIPEIQNQENTLKIIASKDPEFQKRIEELTRQVKLSIEKSKSKRMDYYFV